MGIVGIIDMMKELEAALISRNQALHKIATMPKEPRPDGTFNFDRSAIIEIAERELGYENGVHK